MASLQQLEEAFVKADEAGAKDDALVFATEIKKMRSVSRPSAASQIENDAISRDARAVRDASPAEVIAGNPVSRFVKGAASPFIGGAQLMLNMNPIAQATGVAGAVNDRIKQYEGMTQAGRPAYASQGFDVPELAGAVLSPANLAAMTRIPQAATALGRVGTGTAIGAGIGATSPVTEGQFVPEKIKQTLIGGAAGAVGTGIGEGVAQVIRPSIRPEVQTLLREGVTPTPGQIIGGRAQVIEDQMTSLPILGDAIASARGKGLDEFNRAALRRGTAPINAAQSAEIGREGVEHVRVALSDAYKTLLPRVTFKADSVFSQEVNNVRQMAAQLPPAQAQRFEQLFRDQVLNKMTPQGLMMGERLKEVESQLGMYARGYSSSPDFDARQLGKALEAVQQAIRQNLERANPQYAGALKQINTGWANYSRLRDAASRQGAEGGRFTPAQLSAAVRAGDKTVGKRAFSEGDALMQDLSDAGKNVLSSKYPDSGTIGRAARIGLGLGAVGGAAVHPVGQVGLAALLAGTPAYMPGGRQAAAALLARRPEGAQTLADLLRKASLASSPAVVPLLQGGE